MGVNTNDNNDSPASALGDSIRQAQERNAQASASTTTQTQTRQTIGGLQGLQRMRPVARNTNGAALAALQKASRSSWRTRSPCRAWLRSLN